MYPAVFLRLFLRLASSSRNAILDCIEQTSHSECRSIGHFTPCLQFKTPLSCPLPIHSTARNLAQMRPSAPLWRRFSLDSARQSCGAAQKCSRPSVYSAHRRGDRGCGAQSCGFAVQGGGFRQAMRKRTKPNDLEAQVFDIWGWWYDFNEICYRDLSIKPCRIGADERTRTFTPIKEQRPQRCASTNSATSAHWIRLGWALSSVRFRQ